MRMSIVAALTLTGLATTGAVAQRDFAAPQTAGAGSRVSAPVDPRTEAVARLCKKVTLDLSDSRLEDVFTFIADASGARLEPLWLDDRTADGLDPDALITLGAKDSALLSLLERILDRSTDGFTEATWQMTDEGVVQIGPKSRLNKFAEMRTYDVQDLLWVVPDFRDVPDLDLGSIVQGGGGSSQTDIEVEDPGLPSLAERVAQLRDVITANIEPDQWIDNGGDGASIRYYNGVFLVRAPEYIQRQIDGASYWPDEGTIRRFTGA